VQAYEPIGLGQHVALDYLYVGAGLVAPWVLGFSQHTGATAYALALAVFGLGLNALTDYPGGVLRVIPFRWHRLVEWASPPAFVVVPWLFFAHAGAMPWFLSAVCAAIVLNTAFTRPRP